MSVPQSIPGGPGQDRTLRVLLVSKEFAPFAPAGGIGTYAEIVAQAMAAREDVEVHVLCVHPRLPRASTAVEGVTVHTAPLVQPRGVGRVTGLPATWGRLTQAASVWRAARRLAVAFDVVEAPELYAEGLLLGLRPLAPLVIRLHSSAAQLFPFLGRTGPDARLTAAVEHAAVRRADVVTSTAPNLARAVRDLGLTPARSRAIVYPVRPRPLAERAVDSRLLVFVGRLESRKGPDTLVRALPEVLREVPDARLRLVGSDTYTSPYPSYQRHLEAMAAELGVAHAVEFAGPVPHEEVFGHMAAAAACVFPSRWESFGLVAAEAASVGVPVIVSDIPDFLDYVEDGVGGRVAGVESPEQWARAMIAMLREPERASAMGLHLRSVIRKRADPDVVAELTLEAYAAAISARRERSESSRRAAR